jgi:glycosyltransferase involved in cell wall biosynthesis
MSTFRASSFSALEPVNPVGRRVVVAANSAWNIVNLRAGLIRGLQARGFDVVVSAPFEPAAEERLRALGGQRLFVPVDRAGLNPVADLKLLGQYRSQLASLRPDAFLGFTIKPNIYGCLAARLVGIPAIANISGLGTVFIRGGPLRALVSRLYRLALARAGVVFFQNPDDLALFVERGLVHSGQARLLPGSGVDLDRFQVQPLPDGPPIFLLIARMLGDKGVREFVEAARALRAEWPDARFMLLGPLDPGNRTAIPGEDIERWASEGAVEYLGEGEDVRPVIAQATAIVLPSYREGLPRALLEGAASGRPLIATDVPGCREVVVDGVNGFLCEPRSSESLATAMRKLQGLQPSERAAMGLAGRRRVEERFSEAAVTTAYLEALGKLGLPAS